MGARRRQQNTLPCDNRRESGGDHGGRDSNAIDDDAEWHDDVVAYDGVRCAHNAHCI